MRLITSLLLMFQIFLYSNQRIKKESHRTIHALLVCDDSPLSGIGHQGQTDLKNMHHLLRLIKKQTHVKLRITKLQKNTASPIHISHWLNRLPDMKNNILFFYFAGHGFNQKNSSWPHYTFPTHRQDISPEQVLTTIAAKKSRLSIILSDCCNDSASVPIAKTVCFKRSARTHLKKLFLKTRGTLIASAAAPGEKAYCSKRLGGVFTHAFIQALSHSCQRKNPSWNKLCDRIQADCSPLQAPLFSIEIKTTQKTKRECSAKRASTSQR